MCNNGLLLGYVWPTKGIEQLSRNHEQLPVMYALSSKRAFSSQNILHINAMVICSLGVHVST